jgi:hypothetical protein
MAMCVMAVVGAAPCQCFSPGEPDHIAGMDLLDWPSLALHPTTAGCDNQGLTERMNMPCGASTGLEGHVCTASAGGLVRLEERSRRTVPVNHSADPLRDGCEPVLLISILNFFVELTRHLIRHYSRGMTLTVAA